MTYVPSFSELKSITKSDRTGYKYHSLAILGDCSTQLLHIAIDGYGCLNKYNLDIFESDYDQIDIQLLNPNSEYYRHKPKTTLLFMCNERLFNRYCNTPLDQRNNFCENIVSEMMSKWKMIKTGTSSSIIQTLFIEYNEKIFGNYGILVDNSFISQVKKINNMIIDEAKKSHNVFLIELSNIAMTLGVKNFIDSKLYLMTKMPFRIESLPHIGKSIMDMIMAIDGKIKKCIILDLDNTLWGGVIGDDGVDGIQIGDLGIGPAFSSFQKYLKELKNRGILLAVCSKNNIDTAKEPFLSHPDMVLKLEDFSMFVANWDDKATNIMKIQATLNLGMDSFVFIDDNPFERDLVKQMIPEITVPDIPEDPSEYIEYLVSLNLFETASFSEEDVNRTQQYRSEANRAEFQNEHISYDDYLKDLEMIANVSLFDGFNTPRIAQLTQRSNQFNLRTVRLTENDVSDISNDNNYIPFYVKLKDKFGDYGLISVVVLKKVDSKTIFIEEWLMSCRVLKRGVEEFIINKIVEVSREQGYDNIIGEYIKTPKNSMVSNLYDQFGFRKKSDNRYEMIIAEYQKQETYVKEDK